MLAHLRWSLKSSWKLSFRHSSSVFSFSIFPLPCSLWTTMAYDFSNSQNPKPTSKENKPRKQQNQAKIPHRNIKPKRALVPRLTIPSCSNAEINKPKLREPLRCWDCDFWVWVFAPIPRYYKSMSLGYCSSAEIWWICGWGIRRKGRKGRMKEERRKWRIGTQVSKTQVLRGFMWKIFHVRCFSAPKLEDWRLDFHPKLKFLKLEMLISNFVLPTCPLTKF